jgi:hypothetical protein
VVRENDKDMVVAQRDESHSDRRSRNLTQGKRDTGTDAISKAIGLAQTNLFTKIADLAAAKRGPRGTAVVLSAAFAFSEVCAARWSTDGPAQVALPTGGFQRAPAGKAEPARRISFAKS